MLKYSYDPSGNMVSQTLENVLPPQIIGQPVRQIVAPGEVASFSVVVSDASGVTFQWKFNGADIPGATGDSLVLTKKIVKADEGRYSVSVTNSAGNVTSAPAELMLDSDDDGLPDNWEILNFGGELIGQRSEGDPDSDGISNIDEFVDGTDPLNKTPPFLHPRLTVSSNAGGLVTIVPMKLIYDLGETVTLTATTFEPSVFAGWVGDLNGGGNSAETIIHITMNAHKTVRARFASVVPIPPGLVAFWRGEADARDLVGGHHGAFFAGTSAAIPTITPLGKVGGALSFDGTLHVRVPDSEALRPAQITIEAWIFPTVKTRNTFQTIIAHGFSRPVARPGILESQTWYLGVSNGQPHFFTFPDDDLAHPNAGNQGPETIPLNQWTHLAASFDGATKRLYVNGVLVASRRRLDLGSLIYDTAAVPVTMGWDSSGSSERFNGQIDEVAVYNRALTGNEIVDICNADRAGKDVTQPYFTSPSQLPDAALGTSYTQQVTTILGTAPVSFSQGAGALPLGMTLSSAGVVSGVPSVSGTFDFTVLATDVAGVSAEQVCVLRVL